MSEGSNSTNPNTGVHVPFSLILLGMVVIASLVFGWKVFVGFAVLVLIAALLSIWLAKRDQSQMISEKKTTDSECSELDNENLYYDDRAYCLKCGSESFTVEIGATTPEEIRRFASEAEGWRENPEALKGWMPPGIYCPKGCFAVHITPMLDSSRS